MDLTRLNDLEERVKTKIQVFEDIRVCVENNPNIEDRMFFVEDIVNQYSPDDAAIFKELEPKNKQRPSVSNNIINQLKVADSMDGGRVSVFSSDVERENYNENVDINKNTPPEHVSSHPDFIRRASTIKSKVYNLENYDFGFRPRNNELDPMEEKISEDSLKYQLEEKDFSEKMQYNQVSSERIFINTSLPQSNRQMRNGHEDGILSSRRQIKEWEPKEFTLHSPRNEGNARTKMSILTTKTVRENEELENIIEDLEEQRRILQKKIGFHEDSLKSRSERNRIDGSKLSLARGSKRTTNTESHELVKVLSDKNLAISNLENKLKELETEYMIFMKKDEIEKQVAETNVETDAHDFMEMTMSRSMTTSMHFKRGNVLKNKLRQTLGPRETGGTLFVSEIMSRINALNTNKRKSYYY